MWGQFWGQFKTFTLFGKLKHTLIKIELPKIEKLNPDRYMVATSLSLSAKQKDEIKEAISPYIFTSNDVFRSEFLNFKALYASCQYISLFPCMFGSSQADYAAKANDVIEDDKIQLATEQHSAHSNNPFLGRFLLIKIIVLRFKSI